MLQTGRRDLIPHALQLLPPGEKVNAANSSGKSYHWFIETLDFQNFIMY